MKSWLQRGINTSFFSCGRVNLKSNKNNKNKFANCKPLPFRFINLTLTFFLSNGYSWKWICQKWRQISFLKRSHFMQTDQDMRPSLSWDLTWRTLIASYWHFWTYRLSLLQISSIRWRILPWQTVGPLLDVQTVQEELFLIWFTLKKGTTGFPEISVTNYYIAPYNIPE